MKFDKADGWSDAPSADKCGGKWVCPSCQASSLIEDWEEAETWCEICGTHEARRCPECGESRDHVWGSGAIRTATLGR